MDPICRFGGLAYQICDRVFWYDAPRECSPVRSRPSLDPVCALLIPSLGNSDCITPLPIRSRGCHASAYLVFVAECDDEGAASIGERFARYLQELDTPVEPANVAPQIIRALHGSDEGNTMMPDFLRALSKHDTAEVQEPCGFS